MKWDERVGWGVREGHQVGVGEQDGRVRESGQGCGGWEDEGGRWGRGTGGRAAGLGDFSNRVSAKGKHGHQSQSRFRSDFRIDFQTRFLE